MNEEFRMKNSELREAGQRDIYDRTFDLACGIVRLHAVFARRRGASRILSAQLLRSGTSIGANLEEAKAGQSRADFLSKCRIALKEARETHYWLRLIAAAGASNDPSIESITDQANQIVAILTTIVKKVSTTKP